MTVTLTSEEVREIRNGRIPPSLSERLSEDMPTIRIKVYFCWQPYEGECYGRERWDKMNSIHAMAANMAEEIGHSVKNEANALAEVPPLKAREVLKAALEMYLIADEDITWSIT